MGFQQPQHPCSRGGSASSDAPAGGTYCWPSTSPQHPKKLGRWEREPDPLPDSQTSAVPRCRRTQPQEPGLQPHRAPPAPQPQPGGATLPPSGRTRAAQGALGELPWAVGALGLEPGSLRGVGTAPDTFTAQIWLLEHRAARHKALHHCQGSWHHSSGAAEQIQELTLRWKLGAKVIKPPGKVNTSAHVCERRCLTLEQAVLVLTQPPCPALISHHLPGTDRTELSWPRPQPSRNEHLWAGSIPSPKVWHF